jgi:hypothetical protein
MIYKVMKAIPFCDDQGYWSVEDYKETGTLVNVSEKATDKRVLGVLMQHGLVDDPSACEVDRRDGEFFVSLKEGGTIAALWRPA